MLQESDQLLRSLQDALPEPDGSRLDALLCGAAPAGPEEAGLANQISLNRHLLERVVELDQRINQKLAGKDSVYYRP